MILYYNMIFGDFTFPLYFELRFFIPSLPLFFLYPDIKHYKNNQQSIEREIRNIRINLMNWIK